jgi:RHS repeat-associated protein
MYRLTNEINITTSSAGPYAYTNAYGYDLAGNRLQKIQSSTAIATNTYSYNANDELTNEIDGSSALNYLYDSNGSLTSKAGATATNNYTYDLANKLNGVSLNSSLQASYYYNDQGIRVQTSAPGGTNYFLIDDNNQTGYAQVLEELPTIGGTPSMSYVIGDDVLAQCGSTSATLTYFLQDGHGNNRQLSQMNGTVFSHYTYEANGSVQSNISSSSADYAAQNNITTKLYCGEQYDLNLKMYNLRARYYDPANGRFNQRDTFAGNADDPQSLHKYLYGDCDPVNGSDPSGNFTLPQLLIVIAILVYAAFLIVDWIGPSAHPSPAGEKINGVAPQGTFNIRPANLDADENLAVRLHNRTASNHGFEVEYVVPPGFSANHIRLVQAIKQHIFILGAGDFFNGTQRIDTSTDLVNRNMATRGGIPLPAYTDAGPGGHHPPLSYLDAPGVEGGYGISILEVAAIDNSTGRDQILGCVTFEFNASNDNLIVPESTPLTDGSGGFTIGARAPGSLWTNAQKKWQNEAGK